MIRLHDLAPEFAEELAALLIAEDEPGLAEQMLSAEIVARCRCEEEFCASFYTAPRRWARMGRGTTASNSGHLQGAGARISMWRMVASCTSKSSTTPNSGGVYVSRCRRCGRASRLQLTSARRCGSIAVERLSRCWWTHAAEPHIEPIASSRASALVATHISMDRALRSRINPQPGESPRACPAIARGVIPTTALETSQRAGARSGRALTCGFDPGRASAYISQAMALYRPEGSSPTE